MNENIDLTKILKDCPKGTKLYTTVWGDVEFRYLNENADYPICIKSYSDTHILTKNGKWFDSADTECIIFPSRQQRDWSKFTAPWYKKDKFDPKTLKPFDKVLLYEFIDACWNCDFYSHTCSDDRFPYVCVGDASDRVIPYNDETKHLVGTNDEAPEYYRYWED